MEKVELHPEQIGAYREAAKRVDDRYERYVKGEMNDDEMEMFLRFVFYLPDALAQALAAYESKCAEVRELRGE